MILDQMLIALPLILGAYISLSLLKLPDFSLESAYLLGAISAFLAAPFGSFAALAGACLGGAIVGAIVFILNQKLQLPFLLAAIITSGFFHGLTQYLLGTSVRTFHLTFFFPERLFFIFLGIILMSILFFIFRSQLGYSFAIYGNNPLFFQEHSMSGSFVMRFGLMLGHSLAGLSGFLFALSNGFIDLTMHAGVLLFCLTALILGKSLIALSRPHLLVPLTGLVCYFFVQQSLLYLGLNLQYFQSFQALFVLGVLCILRQKKYFSIDHLGV